MIYEITLNEIGHPQTFSDIFRHPHKSLDILINLQTSPYILGHHRTSSDIHRHPQTSSDILRHPQTSSDILRHLQTSSDIYRHSQTSSSYLRYIFCLGCWFLLFSFNLFPFYLIHLTRSITVQKFQFLIYILSHSSKLTTYSLNINQSLNFRISLLTQLFYFFELCYLCILFISTIIQIN